MAIACEVLVVGAAVEREDEVEGALLVRFWMFKALRLSSARFIFRGEPIMLAKLSFPLPETTEVAGLELRAWCSSKCSSRR